MKRNLFILVGVLLLAQGSALGVKVADITRLSGQRTNVLTGLGLVIGLNGTGDGGKFAGAINPLAKLYEHMGNPIPPGQLAEASNVAVVQVTVTVPKHGALNGDRLDVYVSSMGAARSLRDGRLFITPLVGPVPDPDNPDPIYALASGPITIENANPRSGVVKGGAVMEKDIIARVIEGNQLVLILESSAANWTTASTIAKIINDAEGTGETLAVAENEKYVVVTIPPNERQRPDSFISRIQQLPVRMMPSEARVVINERTGTIIMTGDVQISPVVISHKGLTITTITQPPGMQLAPTSTESSVVPLDTTRQGGARLKELVDALDMIKVPAEDRIIIVRELHRTGKLHAKLEEAN